MRPTPPTFFLLDGALGWRTAELSGASADARGRLRLAADPHGRLSLADGAGSLGGLVLPRGMAFDERWLLYLLSWEEPRIRRFDPRHRGFRDLPGVGGEGSAARQLRQPVNITIAGRNLYVADRGNRRVQVFHLGSLALFHLWGPRDRDGRPVPPPVVVDDPCQRPDERPVPGTWEDTAAWEPADVAAHAGTAYVLDRRYGRVYRHRPGSDELVTVLDEPAAENRWSRLALDRRGRLYLLDLAASTPRLEIYDPQGVRLGEVHDAGEVRSRFVPSGGSRGGKDWGAPAVRLDHLGRFCLPESLARTCGRRPPAAPPSPARPLELCAVSPPGGLTFDREGRPVRIDPTAPWEQPPPYRTAGTWFSQPLDSEIHRCQWHRVELELAELPPGTRVVVSTHSAARKPAAGQVAALGEHLWDTRYAATGPLQGPADEVPLRHEFLVQSAGGQFLALRLELSSDGYATPAVRSLRVHYPRRSYLEYLPAVYSEDEDSRVFLEHFLAIAQTEWDDLERRIAEIARYFDPEAVPEGPFMDELARWLDLPLEQRWSGAEQRRLLAAAPGLYRRRGTPGAVRDFLRVYLWNLAGIPPAAQRDYPVLVEGFRERRRAEPAWDAGVVGRLQLGVYARLGEVRLVSTGDPERDLFWEHAHRFRVHVPSPWVRTAEDESALDRALATEKPAQLDYDLCLVEPRLRVGAQSTVGIDTIIGDIPRTYLACRDAKDVPPSRPPRTRLGYDTVLAGAAGRGPLLAPGLRLGMETHLT